ncbi:ribosome-associated GTPase EngA [Thermovirga lienii DSM 17291]|jgi:GTP-binding protein|uniref:GTPase Der n=1 Tax=Thermovirga lienii (strain ATCC BAA-1197 / DSM 17291 / Cas60314) TaxID=580340 RepID=G7V570_THELD|nr:ribosome biogenesis GTPase Der [Thermovirga lienii]AER66853.1 ribosome-associated GTPase EngA [Thermovirga lienii DSM 17291]MDN5318127.1 GTPase [Thermovirga sp.]MDN5367338.1 GTPase [Thermovirga sp.]HCD71926.1 ribosome biogenesis GTPase Der [Thermovirga lienii]
MAIVTIVGRPNVGKSSLFNRIIGRRHAIVDDQPGVTRDRIYSETEWKGKKFYVVDTGGVSGQDADFDSSIYEQVKCAVEESDVLLLVLDTKAGVTPLDEEIALQMRKTRKPIIVVGNKVDDTVHEDRLNELYALGFDHVIGVSAEHGRNIDELMDKIWDFLPDEADQQEKEANDDVISLALVGRPNVGKSSLLNYLCKEKRSLVSDIPGTTRDSIDTLVEINGVSFRIIDTAGLRRKSRVDSRVEFYSTVRTFQAVDRCDVAVIMMEDSAICTDQDKKIANHVIERGKGLILVVNKWDKMPKDHKIGDRVIKKIREEMAFCDFAPILFTSVKTGRGISKLPDLVLKVKENRGRTLSDDKLFALLHDVLAFERLPSSSKGKRLEIRKCKQIGINPPKFCFFVNDPTIVNQSFTRYIVRILRKMDDFEGTPIRIAWNKG